MNEKRHKIESISWVAFTIKSSLSYYMFQITLQQWRHDKGVKWFCDDTM